jgi:beta-glucosidase
VPTAAKALAGWAQVDLQPGERQKVTVTLSAESLSFWDVNRDKWRTPSGEVPIFVGSSSTDVRLTGDLRVGRVVN